MNKLSVIIPAYNNLPDVLSCLNSLQVFAAGGHEYIVQDDASPDYFGPAVIHASVASCQRNPQNMGFAGNCNAGAARATGDILLFVNQDVYGVDGWSNGWDVPLLEAFNDPQMGIVGARLLFPNGSIQNAGGLYDSKKQPFHRCLGYSNPHHPECATPGPVSWTTGAALAIRRNLFEQAGGFDPIYKMYWEDVDLCLKVRDLGYAIWYEPACTFIHKAGGTGGSPHFMASAMTFKQRWVDTGKIEPDTYVAKVNFW